MREIKINITVILILMTFLLISCRTPKSLQYNHHKSNIKPKSSYKQDSILISTDTWIKKIWTLDHDTVLYCPGYPNPYVWNHQNKTISSGLSSKYLDNKAFEGNKEAENILVLSVLTRPDRGVLVKARGSRLFALMLEPAAKFDKYKGGGPSINGMVKFNYYRQYIYNMIRTIDGDEPARYVYQYGMRFKGFTKISIGDFMLNNEVEFAKLEHEAIVYAWEHGLVVLKDYGEK